MVVFCYTLHDSISNEKHLNSRDGILTRLCNDSYSKNKYLQGDGRQQIG